MPPYKNLMPSENIFNPKTGKLDEVKKDPKFVKPPVPAS